MIIAQVRFVLVTIKGATLMCSFICQVVNVSLWNDAPLVMCEIVTNVRSVTREIRDDSYHARSLTCLLNE